MFAEQMRLCCVVWGPVVVVLSCWLLCASFADVLALAAGVQLAFLPAAYVLGVVQLAAVVCRPSVLAVGQARVFCRVSYPLC